MTVRKLLAAALALPLIAGVATADAAVKKPVQKKPTCRLIQDKKGDATSNPSGQPTPSDPNMDIEWADVATNATTVTVWFQMTAMNGLTDADPNNGSRLGRAFRFSLTGKDGKTADLRAVFTDPDSTFTAAGNSVNYGGNAKIIKAARQMHMSFPLANLPTKIKPNDKLTGLQASMWRWVGPSEATMGIADQGSTAVPYVASWPSCVKVGT